GLSQLRLEDREGGSVTEQGAVQQTLRRGRGRGLRECFGAASGPAVRAGPEHGPGHGSALFGTLDAQRKKPALRHMGVDEIFLGKTTKFVTVVSNLESGEPLWFGRERKQETLDEFFQTQFSARQRQRIEAACVDMWEPYKTSIEQWSPNCAIVYDKFHIMQHAN